MDAEDLFVKRVVGRLNDGLESVPQHIQARLNIARDIALSKVPRGKRHVRVGMELLAMNLDYARQRFMGFAFAIAVALTVVCVAQYDQIQATADEAADIDEEILSDSAPVQAYMDPVFSSVFRSGLLQGFEKR